MEAKEWKTHDRTGWVSDVLWDNEPDKAQWQDEETGLPCLAVRHSTGGHWCGYVGVAEGHPYYQRAYDYEMAVSVHGGLTFSSMCQPGEDESLGVCHTPSPGEPEHIWWLGFDCAHSGDFQPRCRYYDDHHEVYRTLAYVKKECTLLAAQLRSVA